MEERRAGSLFGREAELARLLGLLAQARSGLSPAVVLRGGTGVGKTTLLDAVAEAAGEFDVVRFGAVPAEADLSHAALHQLLKPHLTRLRTLPKPQREALEVAFGLRDALRPADRFLTGLATLGLLSGRPGDRPVLWLIDDADSLDDESAAALSFVARRLYADSTAIVIAGRGALPGFDALPQLELTGLGPGAAADLLTAAAGPVAAPVAARLITETAGNPLALVEAVRDLSAGQLAGDAPLPDPIPLGRKLERRYARELAALAPATRTVLLTAAAETSGDPEVLARAGAELGFTLDDVAVAERLQLLSTGGRTRLRDPALRTAVYYQAPLADRRRVHAALATVTGALGLSERQAWHLGESTSHPDDAVAVTLERAADRERARGGWATASHLLARAAALSTAPADRFARLLAATEASCSAGSAGRAQALLDEAGTAPPEAHLQALAQRARARIHRLRREPAEATVALLAAADHLAAEPSLARDILLEAVVQAKISGRFAPVGVTEADVAAAARRRPAPPGGPAIVGDLLLEADVSLQLDGIATAAPLLRKALTAAVHAPSNAPELFQWLGSACACATVLGDDVTLRETAWRLEHEARRHGSTLPMALAMSHAGVAELIAGRLEDAERCFDRRSSMQEAMGQPETVGALLVAGWRGQGDRVAALGDQVEREAARSGQGYQLVFADYAHFLLLLGQGRYREAYGRLAGLTYDTSQLKFAFADQIEAAVRCGEDEAARRLLVVLTELSAACPVPRTLGDLARARALLAPDEKEAERQFAEAIHQHENTRGPAPQARSHQAYGEWLRRARRTKEARHHLRTAYDLFRSMGANAFADRTAAELSAAGAPVRPRAEEAPETVLTAQESRVARLAAGGATNAEIAGQLYLSVNTVEYHLRKVYRKLGVRSRRALPAEADRLG